MAIRGQTAVGDAPLDAGERSTAEDGVASTLQRKVDAVEARSCRIEAGATPSFRGRQPRHLEFGTSGLRGLISDLTDLEVYIDTRGFLEFLSARGEVKPGAPIALAGDLRPSTDSTERSIMKAVARACLDAGLDVVNCGKLPTPALSYFAFQRGWPSIMVTGSHIPFDRNGIKFNRCHGEVLKSDEAEIGEQVARVRRAEYARAPDASLFGDDGMFLPGNAPQLEPVIDEPRRLYVDRYLSFFPPGALAGLRLVVYQHSAVGRDLLVDILRGLGAEVHAVGRTTHFMALDTEAVSDAQLLELQRFADEVRQSHGPVAAVLSTDGDSDRPLVTGVDASGILHFFGGDRVGLITALYLEADGVVVPVSATDAIERAFAGRGTPVLRTRIGSPHVISGMGTLTGSRSVGWEANGGFLTSTTLVREGRRIEPLPTRDALLPMLCVLHASQLRGLSLPALFAELPQRVGHADLLDEVPTGLSQAVMSRFRPSAHNLRSVSYASDPPTWRDHAGVTHEADATLRGSLLEVQTSLAEYFSAAMGFSPIQTVDYLDGVRIHFTDQDIVHLRPSGNAPQLRVYALAASAQRARELVRVVTRTGGVVVQMLAHAERQARYVQAIEANIDWTRRLVERGEAPRLLAVVSGSAPAQHFWQLKLDRLCAEFGGAQASSLYEDLPVNQALGVLLCWQRLRERFRPGAGALAAFVFGEGTRATPFTETDNGQKPAIESFVTGALGEERSRRLTMVELALRYFAPVEAFLRRSGFEGVVFKWGDELLIPTADLTTADPRFSGADVVRFVSMQALTEDTAANKDWVGVAGDGTITGFIPRRPLAEMQVLADRGVLRRDGAAIVAGINLGSIAISRVLLDALLEEFGAEVNDASARRADRPDLDPQLFTALVIAAQHSEDRAATEAWESAREHVPALAKLERNMPGTFDRLRRVLDQFRARHGRDVRLLAMDFGDVFWGDVGQHQQIHDFYMALNDRGPKGQIARRLAEVDLARDAGGNIIAGRTELGPGVAVENSVLIDCQLATGRVVDCVLIGTRASHIDARGAFDVQSAALELHLEPRAGTYKVIYPGRVDAGRGERVTSLFVGARMVVLRVAENTDLRDRKHTYDIPLGTNPMSFAEAHAAMSASSPEAVVEARELATRAVLALLAARGEGAV